METHCPTINVPATPEYVLAVLLDRSRQEWSTQSLSPEDVIPVTLDSPLETLFEACGLYSSFVVSFYTREWFELSYSEWCQDLYSAELNTARDFCELIAARIMMPKISLQTFIGRTCPPVSVFLTIRTLLHDAGVDVTEIAPSTSLSDFTRKHLNLFLGPISRLAPGVLPMVQVRRHLWDTNKVGTLSVTIFILSLLCAPYPYLMWILWGLALLLVPVAYCNKDRDPALAQFGPLRTFRDLSEVIASRASFQTKTV